MSGMRYDAAVTRPESSSATAAAKWSRATTLYPVTVAMTPSA